jgi:hypothetical protein
MAAKTEIGQLMRDAIQRGRAAERVKGLAALSLVVREYPDNLVAFLWLARCVTRPEAREPRSTATGTSSRRAR